MKKEHSQYRHSPHFWTVWLSSCCYINESFLFSFTAPKGKESFKGGNKETFRYAKTGCWKVLNLGLGFFYFVVFCFKNRGLKTYVL